MAKKVFLVLAGIGLAVAIGFWASVVVTEAQDETQVLVDRLAELPYPAELTPVDEWASDGTFISFGRPQAAARAYVFEGDVPTACGLVSAFYEAQGLSLRSEIGEVNDPNEWCIRTIPGQNITISIETIKSFTLVPDEFKNRPELVTVRYSASRT